MEATLTPILLAPQQGRALWHLGALMNFKAVMSETGGQAWVLEGLADNKMGVPLHVHSQEDELWYVLEGEIAFTLDGAVHRGGPGTFVYIPKGVAHTFQVVSDKARWFGVGLGGRLDQWFFETGAPAQSLTLPPAPAGPPSEAAVQAIVTSLQAYGTDTLGPPPAPIAA
ncbi:MAG: cupin domain-containing protein [Anaerolineales bacterium]|nr:cupin domain-containing protein [Anaerolineales bacterium]